MTRKRVQEIKRKNRTTVAKYLALYLENLDKKKCMITLTHPDETYMSTKNIKTIFIDKVKSILKRNQYKQCQFHFFSVIEFANYKQELSNNKQLNPHLHLQCFCDEIEPLREALNYTVEQANLDIRNCDIQIAHKDDPSFTDNVNTSNEEKKEPTFTYVIKDFLPENFDIKREEFKTIYEGKPMYWCSKKSLPNYLIKKLYTELSKFSIWNTTKDKYALILRLIEDGILDIKKATNAANKGYKKIKNYWYRISVSTLSPITSLYKIKNTTRAQSRLKLRNFSAQNILIFIWQFIISQFYPQEYG